MPWGEALPLEMPNPEFKRKRTNRKNPSIVDSGENVTSGRGKRAGGREPALPHHDQRNHKKEPHRIAGERKKMGKLPTSKYRGGGGPSTRVDPGLPKRGKKLEIKKKKLLLLIPIEGESPCL